MSGFLNFPHDDLKLDYELNKEEFRQVVDLIFTLANKSKEKAKLREELAAARKRIIELEAHLGESQ